MKGLQKKFVVSLLVAGLLPGIPALVATYLYSDRIFKNSIGTNFQELAAAVAKKVEIIVDQDITEAQSLALSPDILHALSKGSQHRLSADVIEVTRHLKNWQAQRQQDAEYAQIILTDYEGRRIAATINSPENSYGNQPWWQSAYANGKGGIFVSNLYLDERYQGYYYVIAVPVKSSQEDPVLGVLRVLIRRDKLLRAIMEVKIGKTGHAMLVSSNGTPLICPILPPKEHLINDPLMQQIAQTQPGWAVAKDDAHGGKNSIVGFAPVHFRHSLNPGSLGRQAWYTFVRQHPDETYAPIYGLLVKVGFVGFGLAIAISFLGFFASRIIVRPIQLLKEEAQSIGEVALSLPARSTSMGNHLQLSKRIEIKTNDELTELAIAFNQMTEALEQSIQTIKKQQSELIQKEKLASIGQLLAALTHDLKNPLGVVRSSAQILLNDKETDQVKKEMCRFIIEEVDRLTYRINDFLRFARPRTPDKKAVKVEDLLEKALWHFQSQGKKARGIQITKEIDASIPLIEVDPDQINDALINLLVNASEASTENGIITIRAALTQDHTIGISITDTGEGISQEHLEKIFEPFFTTKAYGVGLGLTNVRRLVEENGGKITVESQRGKGTTFTLLLPAIAVNQPKEH
jgi:signal transduction histidine kinase